MARLARLMPSAAAVRASRLARDAVAYPTNSELPLAGPGVRYRGRCRGDAPVFVEVGEAGIAVDHAMRRELAVQCS